MVELNREEIGRQASIEGFANELIVTGLLMKKYQNVSLVDLPLSTYDIIIVQKLEHGEEIIRAQIKTARTSISFIGGSRGGVDREYKSGVKTYTQSIITSDLIIGITPRDNGSFDMYFVPTLLIGYWQTKSKGLGKIEALKNNYDMLENCKNEEYVVRVAREMGII